MGKMLGGTDIADSFASAVRGSSSSKNFVVKTGQVIGPFRVGGRSVTIQLSPRPSWISGAVPTFANIVVEGSLDGQFWYPLTTPAPLGAVGIFTFDCMVPLIRLVGDFGAAEGTVHVYAVR